MDHDPLSNILRENHAPEIDVNAKKRAVNLALAAFQDEQAQKNKKYSQGFLMISRLIGMKPDQGERNMEERNKFIFGGAATALALVLVAGLSLTQLNDTIQRFETDKDAGSAVLAAASMNVQGAEIAEDASPAYVVAVEQKNEVLSKQDQMTGASSVPAPVGMIQEERAKREVDAPAKVKSAELPKTIGGIIPASPPVDTITPYYQDQERDQFTEFKPNAFKQVAGEPVSTFSSDVDTASYSFVRRQLNNGIWPQADAVRVEEMVNYFPYNYPLPESREEPFKPMVTVIDSPWAKGKKLMHIGIKGYDIKGEKPHTNLVFLLDVSGSMNEPSKLPLVKASMKMLLDTLNPDDTIAIAVYAGAAGAVLEPTKVSERGKILSAIDNLEAGGSTAGAAGIKLAYQLAEQNFDKNGVNRIILATDGDFNVGTSSTEELKELVEKKRESGVFLSVLGFGQGNYNDAIMQTLAQNGNGVAAYIDTLNEARKVLVDEASSSLFPIAKDVKFQVEFNPKAVAEYRLVGYETRALSREDFNNDKIDAGDIGAGHTVTAIYEFVPVGSAAVSVDPLRYTEKERSAKPAESASDNNEYAFLKIRYKLPNDSASKLMERPITAADQAGVIPAGADCSVASDCDPVNYIGEDVQFSVAVAAFGQILKNDLNIQTMTLDDVINMAQAGKGADPYGYRAEFINLVRLTKAVHR